MAKLYSTETVWSSVNNAMQILGKIGATTVYWVKKLLRNSRLELI